MSFNVWTWLGLSDGVEPCTLVASKLSLLRVLGDGCTTLTKGGRLARVIELRGKDYSGMDSETIRALYLGRKMVFDTVPSSIVTFAQTQRIKTSLDISGYSFSNPLAGDIAQAWAKNFSESYRTRHFLIVCTAVDNFVDRVGLLADGGGDEELYRQLDEYVKKVAVSYNEYSPRVLHGDDLATYWAWLASGRHAPRRLPKSGFLDDILDTADIDFPHGERHMVYRGEKPRYSTFLYVAQLWASATDPRFLDGLYRLHQELSVWQIFRKIDKAAALAEIEDRRRNTRSFKSAGDVIMLELHELETRIQADELTAQRHKFAIEVHGESLAAMEKAAAEVTNVLENQGFGVKREGRNTEAHFWSRFPEFDSRVPKGPPNPRERTITSENAAHFVTYATAGEGLDSCSWGDFPVTHFKTTQGSEYAFTFQSSPAEKAPGHTLVIGGTNSGKSTVVSFLLSQSLKYPNFRAVLFDRLHGLEVFTRLMDGEYLDIAEGLEVNPLALPDDTETRAFLANWFQILTKKNTDAARKDIDSAIRQLFILDRKDRTLANILDAFGLAQEGSMRSAMEFWVNGEYSRFFNASRDAFDFNSQLVGIDMTMLLDLPDVLAPLSSYLFHKLLVQAKTPGGYAVFVDEIPKYLQNPVFAPMIDMLLQEIRKTDGAFIGACQSADTILNSPSADKFLTNIETLILFPNAGAQRKHFNDEGLRLNDQEFAWLTTTAKPREVLVKRKGGESTILNVDLSSLGPYLRGFNSSVDAVAHLNELRKSRDDWKQAYLFGA